MNFIKKTIIFTLFISISLVVSASEKLSKRQIFEQFSGKYITFKNKKYLDGNNPNSFICVQALKDSLYVLPKGIYQSNENKIICNNTKKLLQTRIDDKDRVCITVGKDFYNEYCRKIRKYSDEKYRFGSRNRIKLFAKLSKPQIVQLVIKDGKSYKLNKNKPFTGVHETRYRNGSVKSRISYKNGLKNGVTKVFYKNGKLHQSIEYKDNKRHGDFIEYTDENEILFSSKYKNDLKNGIHIEYYIGHYNTSWNRRYKKYKINFKDGLKDGLSIDYYKENKTKIEQIYVEGIRDGEYTKYREDGVIIIQTNFDRGIAEVVSIVEKQLAPSNAKKRSYWPDPKAESLSNAYFRIASSLLEISTNDHGENYLMAIKYLRKSAYIGNENSYMLLLNEYLKDPIKGVERGWISRYINFDYLQSQTKSKSNIPKVKNIIRDLLLFQQHQDFLYGWIMSGQRDLLKDVNISDEILEARLIMVMDFKISEVFLNHKKVVVKNLEKLALREKDPIAIMALMQLYSEPSLDHISHIFASKLAGEPHKSILAKPIKNSIFIRDEKKAKYWTNFGHKNLSETDQSLISILRN
jgi:antitoxin component YwqK of YwqJK toxin-antitoxin module